MNACILLAASFLEVMKNGARSKKALASLEEERPNVMRAFEELQAAATADGVLIARVKKLIMAALRCEPCLREQVRRAIALGARREEILEAAPEWPFPSVAGLRPPIACFT